MLGIPPSAYTPGAPYRRRAPLRRHRAWALVLSTLGVVAMAALLSAPGAIVDLSVLVLGLVLLSAFLVRPPGGSVWAGLLIFLLVALLTTGILKAAWLVGNLPTTNDHTSLGPTCVSRR